MLQSCFFAADKIAVGSFQGLVRVYRPEPGSFSPDHLLIEHQTGKAILQLETGRFIQSVPYVYNDTLAKAKF